ncbi:MAG: exodeoxyribonuclease V subunit gamma [Salinivirgaceae bacterium]|nr:exodeoxyribonuclease V subunit gamma [Salinivirgaceae bacterium]
MGFKLYTSNKIERLCDVFCENVKERKDWTDISHIVVQTNGMEKWITKQVSSKNKVFANYEFSSPDGFIRKLHQLAKIYSSAYFSAESMKWKLFTLLNERSFVNEFSAVSSFYNGHDIKRVQLAAKVADLFEQYLTYRPNYIDGWNNNDSSSTPKHEDFTKHEVWQKYLWQKLKEDSGKERNIMELKSLLLDKMDDEVFQQQLKSKFPKISLFAISVLSNYHVDIYKKLAEIVDVNLYITVPSAEKNWQSKAYNPSENELLSSCKALGSDLSTLLNSIEYTKTDLTDKPSPSNLLSTIQADIFSNSNHAIKTYETNQNDSSVHIVSSYTPVREVEALYNYLLNEFENDSELKGSDISVQLTDVNLYAPLIKAVFDNAPKKIPYQITDLAYSDGDSLIKALELFINLPFTDYKAESVIQLLEFKAVRNRFDITDIEALREIIADANIRYGIKGRKEDDSYLFSWEHGLKKMILGYAIKGGNSYTIDDTDYYPIDTVEGSNALDIFKIKAFTDTLFNLQELTEGEKAINEWKAFLLKDVIGSLFDTEDNYQEEFDYILKKLENIESIAENVTEKISFTVFQQGLMAMLSSETKNSSYISGQLTFSSIIPVRSMPFKYIAMLGLNSGVFPRKQEALGFDLISIDPQSNDRNTKNNDKYLFLEAILSARKQLYLSYIGSSIKDNSELPPSLLVEELEDYLATGTGSSKWIDEEIKYMHPLHSSSKRYFSNERLFTYLGKPEERITETKEKENSTIDQQLVFNEISIDDLIRFYKDPFKWYYNKTLRIFYSENDTLLPEEEPFELDSLQKWALKSELVSLPEEKETEYVKRKKNDGLIQLANMAHVELMKEKIAVADIKSRFADTVTGDPVSEYFSLKFGDTDLKGKIASIYNEGYVHTNVSGKHSQAKYLMDAWIKHLIRTVANENSETIFISSKHNFKINKDIIDAADAKHTLAQLIEIYKKGHSEIVPFIPKEGYDLIKNIYEKDIPEEAAIDKSIKNIKNDKYRSDYVAKEDFYGIFDYLLCDLETITDEEKNKVIEKRERFLEISKLLFNKLTTLISIQ